MGYKAKSGGLVGNLAKIGGSGRKLSLKTALKEPPFGGLKKGAKQAHKRA